MTGVDLTQIEGVDETTALMVISAIGLERSRWPSEQHCTSWLGWCPQQQVSGGQVLASRTRPTTHRAAAALRLAAASRHPAHRALGAYCRRLQSRLGTPKAITATAHKLARLIDSMLKHGTAYVAQGLAASAQPYQDRVVKHVTRRAKAWGYDLVRTPEDALA